GIPAPSSLRGRGGLLPAHRIPLGLASAVADHGPMTVIDLSSRRRDEDPPTYTVCTACGGAWFELRANHPDCPPHGAVTPTPAGRITGWAGTPHCVACGAPWSPGSQRS